MEVAAGAIGASKIRPTGRTSVSRVSGFLTAFPSGPQVFFSQRLPVLLFLLFLLALPSTVYLFKDFEASTFVCHVPTSLTETLQVVQGIGLAALRVESR